MDIIASVNDAVQALPQGAFLVSGLTGMATHFIKKRANGEVAVGLVRYCCHDYPGRSLSAIVSMVAATFAAFATGGVDHATVGTLVATGFTTGYTLDSLVNKGSTQ